MEKRATKTAAEADAFGKWGRKYLCYLGRAGVRSSIKRQARRRERHDAKEEIRSEFCDCRDCELF
jgi:hypothetical protein